MKNQISTQKIILWLARIIDILILSFLLFFVFGHLFGNSEFGEGFRSNTEILTFVLFPVSTIIGLAMALKWEIQGAVIVFMAMAGLFMLRSDLTSNFYIMMPLIPATLFAIYWISNNKAEAKEL